MECPYDHHDYLPLHQYVSTTDRVYRQCSKELETRSQRRSHFDPTILVIP